MRCLGCACGIAWDRHCQAAHATSAAVRPGPFQIMKFEVAFKLNGQSDGSQRPSALWVIQTWTRFIITACVFKSYVAPHYIPWLRHQFLNDDRQWSRICQIKLNQRTWNHLLELDCSVGLESKYFVFEALLFQRSGLGCIIFMLIELVIAPHKLIRALHNDKIVKSTNNQFCIWSQRLYCHSGKEAGLKIEMSSQDC